MPGCCSRKAPMRCGRIYSPGIVLEPMEMLPEAPAAAAVAHRHAGAGIEALHEGAVLHRPADYARLEGTLHEGPVRERPVMHVPVGAVRPVVDMAMGAMRPAP